MQCLCDCIYETCLNSCWFGQACNVSMHASNQWATVFSIMRTIIIYNGKLKLSRLRYDIPLILM